MDLGQKIRTARLELGLSQRQLCGDRITRNMLSQIENGTAKPSMDTLRYLAGRLGLGVSYFLEDQAVTSPNMSCITRARLAWSRGDDRKALEELESFRQPDALFEEEHHILVWLCCLREARRAVEQGRLPYAVTLLDRAEQTPCIYVTEPIRRQLSVLRGLAGEKVDAGSLCDGEALLLRARLASDPRRSLEILSACEDRQDPKWQLQAAGACFQMGDYTGAKRHYLQAEAAFPGECWPKLEQCCRELGDYKGAYEYACRQR